MTIQTKPPKSRTVRRHRSKIKRGHGLFKQDAVKKPICENLEDTDLCDRARKLRVWTALNPKEKVAVRKAVHEDQKKLTAQAKRLLWKNTTNLTETQQQELEKYLRNAGRGRLPSWHDGADVTRSITEEQVAKLLACEDCVSEPKVFLQVGKKLVGVCGRDWVKLSDTVIGWGERGS